MASVRRFGSCSSCQLRNVRENGRRWKCRSAVPEWLVGSRIKAQGEEEDDRKKETGASKANDASQAGGVGPWCVSLVTCFPFSDVFCDKGCDSWLLFVLIASVTFCVCVHCGECYMLLSSYYPVSDITQITWMLPLMMWMMLRTHLSHEHVMR